MCSPRCIAFVLRELPPSEIVGKSILEVGARDFNGSVRPAIEAQQPAEYIGTDIIRDGRVDQVVDAVDLVATFGERRFDVVICTEMLEHAERWRAVVSNLKRVLKPGGLLLITTRSVGFPIHGYPQDYWRYGIGDMQNIFADFDILALELDLGEPGVFLKARKPLTFAEVDLLKYALYSINELKRIV